MHADPAQLEKFNLFPAPTSRKALQRILGVGNYLRRFIRDYASIAAPLTHLTGPTTKFVWTPEAEMQLSLLKAAVKDCSYLHFLIQLFLWCYVLMLH